MSVSNFPLLFLQASISALVTCSIAWCILRLAQRRWSGVGARRTPWLLAQLVGASTLVVVALPAASHLSLFSIEQTAGVVELTKQAPSFDLSNSAEHGTDDLSTNDPMPTLAWAWLGAYLAGLSWYGLRLQRRHRDLRILLSVAQRLDHQALLAHPAFASHGDAGLPVLELDAAVSPLLAGLAHPVLLLPTSMRDLPQIQQQLIVAHELTHLRRHDHAWQHAGALLQVLLWFIPSVRSFNRSLQWAVELGCDRAVLAGRPNSERRSYAAALLAQLAAQTAAGQPGYTVAPALAFGLHGARSVAERIQLIRDTRPAPGLGRASLAALLLLPALCGASVLLQPQFGWNAAAPPAHATGADGAPGGPAWGAPLARIYVTSAFGALNRPGGKAHNGTDFRAARGTPVFAPASGKVAISTDRYEGGERYGKVIVIEHEGGLSTLYAHLDSRAVETGAAVQAGQQIALSGATGKVSGPHLHVEVSRQGTYLDPQAVLEGAPPSPQR